MNTTHTRAKVITAIASIATPAVLFLGAATAHAVAPADDPSTLRTCSGCTAFNPQPDPPSFPDLGSHAGIGNPNDNPAPGVRNGRSTAPGGSVALGGPDTAPAQHN